MFFKTIRPRNAVRRTTRRHLVAGTILLLTAGCHATVNSSNGSISINGPNVSINGNMPGKNSANDAVQQKFDAANVSTIKTEIELGSVEVIGSPSADNVVHIVATRTVRGNEAPEELKKLLVKITPEAVLNGHTLVISAKIPGELQKNSHSASVDYQIKVPERMLFDLRSDAGKVKVSGLRQGGTAHTDAGDIEADHLAGTVNLTTSAGKVTLSDSPDLKNATVKTDVGEIQISAAGGTLQADTSNGEIHVEHCSKTTQLTVHSDNGAVHVSDCTGSIDAGSNNGEVSATRCTVTNSITLKSDTGSVQGRQIKAVGNSLTVDVETVNGSVSYDGDGSKLTAKSTSGSVDAKLTPALKLASANVSADNGEATLVLPESASATVKVESQNGRAEVPGGMAATESSSNRSTIQMGNGNADVQVQSSNGNAVFQVSHP